MVSAVVKSLMGTAEDELACRQVVRRRSAGAAKETKGPGAGCRTE